MTFLAVFTAFAVGFAMKYGGLCTYAATLQILRGGRFERLLAFFAAAARAALVIVPSSWFRPETAMPERTHARWPPALAGGMLLVPGAHLNRGRVFGTFVQLAGGNLTYVATLFGLVAGAVGGRLWLADPAAIKTGAPLAGTPGPAAFFWLSVAGLVALLHLLSGGNTPGGRRRAPLPAILVALVLGVGGGGLFAAIAGWDFAAVLTRTAYRAIDVAATGPAALAMWSTLAMVAGGIVAAVSPNRFAWQAPALMPALASLVGGALMGLGAIVLPGGNDGLLLSGIPALAPHALIGLAVMLATMLALLKLAPNDGGYSIGRRR